MKLIPSVFFLLLSYSIFAQQQRPSRPVHVDRGGDHWGDYYGESGSALTIFSENGDVFSLLINGIKQNNYPQQRVRVEGLPQIVNDIQIIFADNYPHTITKRIPFIDPVDGKAINLILKIVKARDGESILRFFKSTPIESNYQPDQNEYVMYYGRDVQVPNSQIVNNVPPPPIPQGPQPMDPQSFAAAISTISGNNFDDGKLSTAKAIANSNYFTTDQVIQVCKVLQWDESKLDFAKYAFKRTVDNNNYFKVNSVFQWDSNKQALNDFVNQNR